MSMEKDREIKERCVHCTYSREHWVDKCDHCRNYRRHRWKLYSPRPWTAKDPDKEWRGSVKDLDFTEHADTTIVDDLLVSRQF